MRLIRYILKIDYSLCVWLASTKERIIPGAAFLFLNKTALLATGMYFIVLPLLPFRLDLSIATGILCSLIALIMYGMQSKIETAIRDLNYSKDYSKLSNKEKVLHRLYGLAIFIGCYILMFVVGVVFFAGYGK